MMRLIPALAVALLVGCNSMPKPIPGRADPYVPEQINIAQGGLRDRTAFLQPNLSRDAETDILYVSVPARATTNQQLYIEYRVVFLDERGMEINPNASWMRKTLAPNVWTTLTANSTTPRAMDFRMDLRFGRIN